MKNKKKESSKQLNVETTKSQLKSWFFATDAERAQMAYQFRTLGWPKFVDMFGLETMNLLLEDVGLPPLR